MWLLMFALGRHVLNTGQWNYLAHIQEDVEKFNASAPNLKLNESYSEK